MLITDKSDLLARLKAGASVITPNNRLASELHKDFISRYPERVQAKPRCLPYSAYLQQRYRLIWQDLPQKDHPLLLNSQQADHLWRKLLGDSVNEGLLAAIKDAWKGYHLWQLDINHPAFSEIPQTRQFQLWAKSFQSELDSLWAITEVELVDYLIQQRPNTTHEEIIWACFDDFTPQQRALQAYDAARGCTIIRYDLGCHSTQSQLYEAKDEGDEIKQLIAWLQSRLLTEDKKIGVVIPDLQSQSQSLQRLLQKQLPPGEFNISLGQTLFDYPLIAHALVWLGIDNNDLNRQQALILLHSPFFSGSKTEFHERMQFMEEASILGETQFTKSEFCKALELRCPKLVQLLGIETNYPTKARPLQWAVYFKERLMHAGFPGEYSLNSASYQAYQRLLGLFDEFSQLGLIYSELTKEEAINLLGVLARSIIFQPKKSPARIHILGLLEASGCEFDSLWFLGATDQALPQKARLSAFIPLDLQRNNLMPHASAERELKLAKKITERFCNSASTVIYSFARLSKDKPNLPSPLVADWMAYKPLPLSDSVENDYLVFAEDDYILPLGESEGVSGGTLILANQAKCPFRAFAAHRLNAKATMESSEGPDAAQRGQLIHKVMELLWRTLQSQANLLSMPQDALDSIIETAILTALEPIKQLRPHSFPKLVQQVELKRLQRLVHACLEWERQRPPFVVHELEKEFNIPLSGLNFKLRVDRLDELRDGKKWVIDYKSSFPTSLPWKEERPKEPQLLLYALLDEQINTLLFAQLKNGQIACKGFSEEQHDLPGLSTPKKDESWTDYRRHWLQELEALASEFSQGYTAPNPASPSVCELCDFQTLCRFNVNS